MKGWRKEGRKGRKGKGSKGKGRARRRRKRRRKRREDEGGPCEAFGCGSPCTTAAARAPFAVQIHVCMHVWVSVCAMHA